MLPDFSRDRHADLREYTHLQSHHRTRSRRGPQSARIFDRLLLHAGSLYTPFIVDVERHLGRCNLHLQHLYGLAYAIGAHDCEFVPGFGDELCRSYSKFRFVCLGVLLPALVLVGGFELRNGVDMEQLSVITENRTDLWKVAWAKFTEKPLTGYGADSWGDDLISRLPGLYQVTAVVVTNHAGGYHNAYFTSLQKRASSSSPSQSS